LQGRRPLIPGLSQHVGCVCRNRWNVLRPHI